MRFMIIRRADAESEAGAIPSEGLTKAMAGYNEQLVKAGVMLQSESLYPSSQSAWVKFSGGKPKVLDGPFAEVAERIARFMMIDVRSMDEAIEWVKRWPVADGGGEAEIEIRQVAEPRSRPLAPWE